MYQLRIFGLTGVTPLISQYPSLAECVKVAETDLYMLLVTGTAYTCEIWKCVGAAPVKIEFTKTFYVTK